MSANRTLYNSLDWSRKYDVLSISRLYLQSLGYSFDDVSFLTDGDMQRIADEVSQLYPPNLLADHTTFVTNNVLQEVRTTGEQHE